MIALALLSCATTPEDTEPLSYAVDCPPAEPTGLTVGEAATDVAATDCAGAAVSLHGLCGRPALITYWYGWCPSCEGNAELARELADDHPGLAVAVVLAEDPLNEPVDAEFCALYEGTYPSAAEVWMDPGGALEVYGTTDLVLILDRAGTVRFVRQTATEEAIRQAVDEVLSES